MSHYGVRRLIAINSGGFIYAELDLSKPVHLVAPNNRGKSTLVNALQFLYVDDMTKMVFGRRTSEDTRHHYFGHDPSYLVFECATPSGIQCLLVRGLGPLRNFGFERYVFQREYARQDFEDEHRRVASFDILRSRLANRTLLEVPTKQHYWEILAGQSSTEGKDVPRLGILPLKTLDEYKAFREVFVSLLKLSNMDGRNLQELIIACHAREITEMRLDIAATYKAEFERAERAEQDVAFVQAVRSDIDCGSRVRADEAAILAQLAQAGPQVIRESRRCQVVMGQHQAQLATAIVAGNRERGVKEKEQWKLEREAGVFEERLRVARESVATLEKDHTKWAAYSPLTLQSLRDKIETLEDRIAQLRQNLQRNLDPAMLSSQVERLDKQLIQEREALKHWDKTAFTALRGLGMSEPHLFTTFRVLNPGLLNLIVGQTLSIKNEQALLANLESLRERIERSIYSDPTVEAHLESVTGPDLVPIRNKERLRSQITINEQNLGQAREQLNIAKDQTLARKELEAKTAECRACQEELAAYERHTQEWQKRTEREARVNEIDERLVACNKAAVQIRMDVEVLIGQIRELRAQEVELGAVATRLREGLRILSDSMMEVGLEIPPLAEDSAAESDPPADAAAVLTKRAEEIGKQLTILTAQVRKIRPLREELLGIQANITRKSSQFSTQPVHFNDRDEEWRLLLDKRDSLDSLEQVSKRQWDALFTTLGARLNGIRLGMRSIEQAVTRINGGLKRYRVSNLREVQLKVEKSPDTYPMIEALTNQDGLFQNRDLIEEAKNRLRIMIESAQPIELHSLFALHIRVQQNDGQWMEAKSLDEIGSTGTGMTAKAMIFIQLVRAIVGNERYRLHFYMDETGHLDDQNLHATTAMAMSKGILPITAEPDVRIDPLAHPEVTVYALGQNAQGRFHIEACNTYRAARVSGENTAATEIAHG